MDTKRLPLPEKRVLRRKIADLMASDGWQIITNIMKEEREDLFRKFASPKFNSAEDNINYNRGVIEASYRLDELPSKLLQQLEEDITIEEAMAIAMENKPESEAKAANDLMKT